MWSCINLPVEEQCKLLGRGERSIIKRLKSLKDVNSNSYKRLFTTNTQDPQITQANPKTRLARASEILQRIKFDYYLASEDYSVIIMDRTEGSVQVPFDAENDSISGSERQFVFAIPEHRIEQILFRRRVVWNKAKRIDLFGDIATVQNTYDLWLEETEKKDREKKELASHFKGFDELLETTENLDVRDLVNIYDKYIDDIYEDNENSDDDNSNSNSNDLFKRLITLTFEDDPELQNRLLTSFDEEPQSTKSHASIPSAKQIQQKILPELNEDDIEESFVKGGGAGGQKINKTASKVVLIHRPTKITVATQKTRSLQQNRKIARKMLAEQVDVHLNGEKSKLAMKGSAKSNKKSKAKAKARRNREKKSREKENENEEEF
ncbi:hypothetical protein TL16_g08763 [Triparma laevis f. inornata]|uniref:Prokaryotic-type class I peptide chain release factors domain-containing protein n=1 Tax=Triparma laevis f. inornata TaxID=1714386 RepID=A0A9W7B6W9_9STRA|nr:hypothetical protein TL16_g08763 [Triparma laevis f. inornata]